MLVTAYKTVKGSNTLKNEDRCDTIKQAKIVLKQWKRDDGDMAKHYNYFFERTTTV